MAVELCSRCEKRVDLDVNSEEIVYLNLWPVCLNCLTAEELDKLEEEGIV